MKKYLISGLPPSNGGVGQLMRNLEQIANKNDYEVIYPWHINRSLKNLLVNPFSLVLELWRRFFSKKDFVFKIRSIKKSEVIFIHPQTIGYEAFFSLIKNNYIVKLYIMDNSFFCIKSYNTLNGQECLKCLNNLNACDSNCYPFPVRYKKNNNLDYLEKYKIYSSKILFYAQNESQSLLIKTHFGKNTNVEVIGMKTNEVFNKHIDGDYAEQHYIVYHGTHYEAKGICYFVELARVLPDFSFFIPYNVNQFNCKDIPDNVTCKSMSWNTGLKDKVINAKLVLNPSLWSAPVEGALLKSIYYNGKVGIVKSKFGFGNDIPNNIVLNLSNNIQSAKEQINNYFINTNDFSKKSKSWLNTYRNKDCSIDFLFKSIEN